MALRPHIERLLHITQHVFAAKSFSKAIGSDAALLLRASETEGVSFSMKIPDRICRYSHHNTSVPLLPASSALALFDDLSSYSFMVKDRNARGGVSVVLSTEILRDIPAGSEVVVHSTISKIGKSIGFSDLYMFDTANNLVARGYHTKYLPMGLAWDFASSPWIAPISLFIYDNIYVKIENTKLGKAAAAALLGGRNKTIQQMPPLQGVGAVFDAFNIMKRQVSADQSFCEYSFNTEPFMCNIRGFLHGGCVAMVAEHAALQTAAIAVNKQSRVSRIDVQYLNAMQVLQYMFFCFCFYLKRLIREVSWRLLILGNQFLEKRRLLLTIRCPLKCIIMKLYLVDPSSRTISCVQRYRYLGEIDAVCSSRINEVFVTLIA
jgi:acyl-coenzyme A thioesterase PaaI-like protein